MDRAASPHNCSALACLQNPGSGADASGYSRRQRSKKCRPAYMKHVDKADNLLKEMNVQ